jgi:hypothetical protein
MSPTLLTGVLLGVPVILGTITLAVLYCRRGESFSSATSLGFFVSVASLAGLSVLVP